MLCLRAGARDLVKGGAQTIVRQKVVDRWQAEDDGRLSAVGRASGLDTGNLRAECVDLPGLGVVHGPVARALERPEHIANITRSRVT